MDIAQTYKLKNRSNELYRRCEEIKNEIAYLDLVYQASQASLMVLAENGFPADLE